MNQLNSRNWQTLLLATLMRCSQQLPGTPGNRGVPIENIGEKARDAYLTGRDVDEVLEMARERGHKWMG
jgi:hypothetical protein